MTRGRDNAAESLGDVIELLRMRRRSGLLSVERMWGARFEEGEIYFQGGRPVYARTGQMSGQEAFIWLLSWDRVYFTFLAYEPRLSSAVPVKNDVAVAVNTSPLPDSPLNTNRTAPMTAPRLPQVNTNEVDSAAQRATARTPGLEQLVPQKLRQEQDVLSLPLTRPQRLIYMLIDGHRTVSDLARCIRKSLSEIERLLLELQKRGLIAISREI